MTPRQITPALALAVSMEAAKFNMRIDGSALDAILELWLRGVIRHAENFTQRAFVEQSWRVSLDRFPDGVAICLNRSPVISVEFIKFYDSQNYLQTLDPADYLVDSESEPGFVMPGPGKAWPATYDRVNAVSVQFKCGYGPTGEATPEDITLYILAKLAEQFDPSAKPDKGTVQSSFIDGLLQHHRVY